MRDSADTLTSMRIVLPLAFGIAAAACWPGPPVYTPPAAPARRAPRPPRPLGAFGVYRVLKQDPFASGPATWDPMSPPSTWPSSGSTTWSWGFTGTRDVPVIHYLVLHGEPDDGGSELAAKDGVPPPHLPDGARMLYFGKEWETASFVFKTVAVESALLLDASHLESCTIKENQNHDSTHGQDIVTMQPWIDIHFTKEGERKLSTVPTGTALSVAFGDEALTLMWMPEWTDNGWYPPHFPVEGVSDEGRAARAKALADACDTQRRAAQAR